LAQALLTTLGSFSPIFSPILMPMAKILAFLPPVAATAAVQATMTPAEGLKSILTELMVALIFLCTWTLTKYALGKKEPEPKDPELAMTPVKLYKKAKKEKTADEVAETIVALCAEQFTRGLRLYRDLVKNDQDKQVTGTHFHMSMVEASVRVGKPDVALQVVERLRQNETPVTPAFVESVLKLLAARKLYKESVEVWRHLGDRIPPQQVILSCVAVAACETDRVDLGRELLETNLAQFPQLPSREWLSLMRYHLRKHSWEGAQQDLLALMEKKMPIDNIVFNTVLQVCAAAGADAAVEAMPQLIAEMQEYEQQYPASEATVDVVSYNTLLKAYARLGNVQKSFELFERFKQNGIVPDDVTFSTLLDVCIDEDEHQLASVALDRMSEHGVQMNCVVLTTLMKGFVRSKRLDKALQLYDSMRSSSAIKPDMITHSMLIKAFCDASDMSSALRILEDLLESGCDIDDVVFTHLIEGCAQVTNVRLAERLFHDMRRANITPSVYTLNGLVKIYGKQREYQAQAAQLIRSMEAEFGIAPTVVIYTCLVSGQIRTKNYADAYKTFCWMRETMEPDLHGFQTMVTGLADGGLWAELSTLAPECAEALGRDPRKGKQSECLNHALTVCCNRGQAACAGVIKQAMLDHGIEVTVPDSRLPK